MGQADGRDWEGQGYSTDGSGLDVPRRIPDFAQRERAKLRRAKRQHQVGRCPRSRLQWAGWSYNPMHRSNFSRHVFPDFERLVPKVLNVWPQTRKLHQGWNQRILALDVRKNGLGRQGGKFRGKNLKDNQRRTRKNLEKPVFSLLFCSFLLPPCLPPSVSTPVFLIFLFPPCFPPTDTTPVHVRSDLEPESEVWIQKPRSTTWGKTRKNWEKVRTTKKN